MALYENSKDTQDSIDSDGVSDSFTYEAPTHPLWDTIVSYGGSYSGKCFCDNGIPIQGEKCESQIDGNHACKSCDLDFTLLNGFCVSNECIG